jgi:hypothetical protein
MAQLPAKYGLRRLHFLSSSLREILNELYAVKHRDLPARVVVMHKIYKNIVGNTIFIIIFIIYIELWLNKKINYTMFYKINEMKKSGTAVGTMRSAKQNVGPPWNVFIKKF